MTVNDGNESIAERLRSVRERIAAAAHVAGRDPRRVRLIAISKTQPADVVRAAFASGQTAFGENQVQEALTKIDACDSTIEWHLVGHLQSNKAKLIPGRFQWLHSLDSLATAAKLARATMEAGASLQTLIQVNVTRDPAKAGIDPGALFGFLDQLLARDLGGLVLRGLMTIGPYGAPEPKLRQAFAHLRELQEACVSRFGLREFDQLSMGMSEDFPTAIYEGATLVRIGRELFGTRPRKPRA